MSSTASSAKVLPFPQDHTSEPPLHPPVSYEEQYSTQSVDDYYYNNNNARARIVDSPAEDEPSPVEQVKQQQARDKARAEAFMARVKQERWLDSVGVDIPATFEDVMGRPMPKVVQNEIAAMIAAGVHRSLVNAVLVYTADAPRPSWAYARAVIQRNYAKGITDGWWFMESIGRVYGVERGGEHDDD